MPPPYLKFAGLKPVCSDRVLVGFLASKRAIIATREIDSTLTDRYQTTVPETVRRALKLRQRDKIHYSILPDGTVLLPRATQVEGEDAVPEGSKEAAFSCLWLARDACLPAALTLPPHATLGDNHAVFMVSSRFVQVWWIGILKKQWPYFLLVFLLPVIGTSWWWGMFAKVQITTDQVRGPYHYAYLVQNGDFSKLPEAQQTALHELKLQKIETGTPITVLLTDPRTTPRKEWAGQVGYLVAADAKIAEPLKVADIPERRVIIAQVRAHPSLAPGKAYSALIDYLDAHGMKLTLPTVETFNGPELTVEMGI